MTQKIYHDDNLYVLNEILACIDNAISLDISFQDFLDHLVENIFFVDMVLEKMYRTIKENTHMINKQERLRIILKTKAKFRDILTKVCSGNSPFSVQTEPFHPRLEKIIERCTADIEDIQDLFISESGLDDNNETISTSEYEFLFKDDTIIQ